MKRKLLNPLALVALLLVFFVFIFTGYLLFFLPPSLPLLKVAPIPFADQLAEQIKEDDKSNPLIQIDGFVTDEKNEFYKAASINIFDPTHHDQSLSQTSTDAYGRFRILTTAGDYILQATAAEALSATTKTIQLSTDAYTNLIHLELPRGRQLQGMVLAKGGEIIAGASISISADRKSDAILVRPAEGSKPVLSYSAISDASGLFCFSSVWPGSYWVIAGATRYLNFSGNLATGKEEHQIILSKTANVKVIVSDQNNKRVFMADVLLKSLENDRHILKNMQTSQYGEAIFDDLLPGQYSIEAEHRDYQKGEKSSAHLCINQSQVEWDLRLLQRTCSIRGQVVDVNSGAGVSDFKLQLYAAKDKYHDEVVASVTSDATGYFQFTNVRKGSYDLAESTFREENANSDYSTKDKSTKILVGSSDAENVRVRVEKKAIVSGQVLDSAGAPVANASIYCDLAGYKKKCATSDNNGKYSIALYKFSDLSWSVDTNIIAFHPEKGYGETQKFKPKPGERYEGMDIILGSCPEVYGAVKSKKGSYISDARVHLFTLYGFSKIVYTGVDGYYSFPVVPETAGISASATGFVSKSEGVFKINNIKQAKRVQLDFTLTPLDDSSLSLIAGTVVDSKGNPFSDAKVEGYSESAEHKGDAQFGEVTDKDGKFTIRGVKANDFLHLTVSTKTEPMLVKEIPGVKVGRTDLYITLDFEPIDLVINFKPLTNENTTAVIKNVRLNVVPIDDQRTPALEKRIQLEAEPYTFTYPLNASGRYYSSAYGDGASGEGYSGELEFSVDYSTPRPLEIELPMKQLVRKNVFHVIGQCITPEGDLVVDPYQIIVRRITEGLPWMAKMVSQDMGNIKNVYTFMLKANGIYEFVYLNQSGEIFDRKLLSLRAADAVPWQGEEAIFIRLPDAVMAK